MTRGCGALVFGRRITINWKNVTVKLKDLDPWDENPKGITKKRAKALLEYWDEIGQFQTIAIGPKNGNGLHPLYDGHQRLDVLKAAYGPDLDIDARESSRALDGDERAKMTLMSIVGTTGFIDWDIVTAWDNPATQEWGLDADTLNQWNVDAGQLKTRLQSEEENAGADTEPQIDKAEELRQQWGVELGQMWQLGEHRLICGDCTDKVVVDRVMGGEVAKYAMQDPPYGIDVVGGSKSFGSVGGSKSFGSVVGSNIVKANNYKPIEGDNKPFDPDYILSLCANSILWGANYYADKLPPKKAWVVWDKKGKEWNDNFSDCELAWSPFDKVTKVYRFLYMGIVQEGKRETRQHPTQKPTGLYELLIRDYFIEDGMILDCYSGSGTTIIACENLNRKCRAVEIDPGYVAVTLQRYADHTGKTPVLIE